MLENVTETETEAGVSSTIVGNINEYVDPSLILNIAGIDELKVGAFPSIRGSC